MPRVRIGPFLVTFRVPLHTSVFKIGDRSDQKPTHSASNQRGVMYTCLVGYRAFGHKSNNASSVFSPTGKVAKYPVGSSYQSKMFFNKSVRPPDFLQAKDVVDFYLFFEQLKLPIENRRLPAEE